VYRARESARPDGLFHDRFAQVLAGERGQAIAALMPRQARNGWPLIARTKLMDDLILTSIAQSSDCVVNLAAGFDTRPYRLDVSASLRWIEADLPALTEEKEQLLKDAQPRCQLRRIKVDPADSGARAAMLKDAVGPSRNALVITEGLLLYLPECEGQAGLN
jgi:methyltransferase (TIGR00027 family)